MESSQSAQDEYNRLVLGVCCRRSAAATIQSVPGNATLLANFASFSDDQVTFEQRDRAECTLSENVNCYVSFCYGYAVHLFSAIVKDWAAPRVVLTRPRQIFIERRASLRQLADSDLQVKIEMVDGQTVSALPRDLSLTGIRAEVSPQEGVQLAVADCVTVELSVPGSKTRVAGVVQRREGDSYGIAFPEAKSRPGADVPDIHQLYISLLHTQRAPDIGQLPVIPAPAIPTV